MLYVVVFIAFLCYNIFKEGTFFMKLYFDKRSKDPIYYVQHGYRIGKKVTTKNVYRIGKHSELLKIHNDPLAYAKEVVKQMNETGSIQKVELTIGLNKLIDDSDEIISKVTYKNIGYIILQNIYKQLGLNEFFNNLNENSKATYSFNDVNRFLTFARIIDPSSKFHTVMNKDYYYECPDFEYQHIERFLDVLYENISLVCFSQLEEMPLFVVTCQNGQFLYNAETGMQTQLYDSLAWHDDIYISGFYRDYLVYEEYGKFGLLSPEGNVIIEAKFDLYKIDFGERDRIERGHAYFQEIFHGRKYGFYIENNKFYGKVPVDKYDSCIRIGGKFFNNYYIVKTKGKYRLLNHRCDEIAIPLLDEMFFAKKTMNSIFGALGRCRRLGCPLSETFLIGLIDVIIYILIGEFIFHVPLKGNTLLVFLFATIFLMCMLSFGIFVSIVMKSQLASSQVTTTTTMLPAFLLSGFVFDINNMPQVIQWITYLFPARYFVDILRGLYLKGVGLEYLYLNAGFLIFYSAILLVLCRLLFKLRA